MQLNAKLAFQWAGEVSKILILKNPTMIIASSYCSFVSKFYNKCSFLSMHKLTIVVFIS